MNEKATEKRNWSRRLYRGLRWIIPIVILYLVFQRIDFATFKQSIARTNPWLVILGVIHYPLLILVGALRWRFMLRQYLRRSVQLKFVLKHYWVGLALGFFVPASLGWDAYRVVVAGRLLGQYSLNVAIIFVEKFLALVTCMSIIIVLYPFISIAVTPQIETIFNLVYILFFVSIFLIAGIIFAWRNRMLSKLSERLELYLTGMLGKIGGRLGLGDKAKDMRVPWKAMIKPLAIPRQLLGIVGLSFGIQLVGAVRNQILFFALGYDLSFTTNLFIVPMLFFIFLLPISFGSLGIREGAFIILYGLFGVPAEIALLVSFFNLFGLLLNSVIGGVIMLLSNINGGK